MCVLGEANSRLGFVEGEASCFAGGEEGVRNRKRLLLVAKVN